MQTVLLIALLMAGLSACSKAIETPTAADLERVQSSRPRDARLAERYERSCMLCHTAQGSGAPLTAYAPDWNKRLAQGMDQMVKHAVEGLNAMPARGQCNDCSVDDLRALTEFMSGKEGR